MKNQNLKTRKFLFLCTIVLLIFSSCKISTEKISKDDLIKNEELILNEVYSNFFGSKEYVNGMRMNPPMQFDQVYIYCLNMNENNIDFNALKNEEMEMKWDDLTMDEKDVEELIKNNIPIVQMSFHWWDPMSQSGNNKWVTKTYFFPECKYENNKLNLGMSYYAQNRIHSINYFPYFYDNMMYAPISGGNWLDLKSSAIGQNVNYNGTIYKLSDLLEKNKNNPNTNIDSEKENMTKESIASSQINQGTFTIISDRCYFYSEPSIENKRNAYLVKGESGSFNRVVNGFLFVSYTNTEGITTEGWLNKSDLEIN
jgi:hypothetical protein